ncbi:MAG TPA: hypothetical protein GX511_08005 [Firmicutes bacterium]|nr:hypothetical protein [Bacillota bacterium]
MTALLSCMEVHKNAAQHTCAGGDWATGAQPAGMQKPPEGGNHENISLG